MGLAYNSHAVVVNVCAIVKFLLDLSVLVPRPVGEEKLSAAVIRQTEEVLLIENILNTTRVKGCLVHALSSHCEFGVFQ